MFVTDNKLERLTLGKSTHGRCRMQRLKQITNTSLLRECKRKVAPQMNKICCPHGGRTLFVEVVRKLLQTFRYIGGHIALLLDILSTPTDVLTLTL